MSNSALRVALLTAALGFNAVALAHTAFIAPASVVPGNDHWVSLDAGLTEELFKSDIALDKSTFQVMTPAGKWQKPERLEQFKTRTLVEHQLLDNGTYRFSTGVRAGAVVRVYELNGERKTLRDAKQELPAGAKFLETAQSFTLAETYLTHDLPSATVLTPSNKGLELQPLTHPNQLLTGQAFKLKVLADGKPVADKDVRLLAAAVTGQKPLKLKTDAQGEVELKLDTPGLYLLGVRHSLPAPKGSDVQTFNYSYNLTLEVKAPEQKKAEDKKADDKKAGH